jgi:hypothetical protein
MARQVILYLLICFGALLLGRHALFNLRPLLVAYISQEGTHEDLPSERRHAFFAIGILLVLFTLISMLMGLNLFFIKIFILCLFFSLGLLLGVQKDLITLQKSEELYIEKEERRIKNEFFFWAGIVLLIFILSLFVFS